MIITKHKEGSRLNVALEGHLDTLTAPELQDSLMEDLPETTDLILDFKNISYVSSAGLRVLLYCKRIMNKNQGSMKLINVCDDVMGILEVTGFTDVLTIE